MDELPRAIRIGPAVYRVDIEKSPKANDNDGNEISVFGKVSYKNCVITIDSELAPIMQWQCLWHEIMHVFYDQLGIDNEDERMLDALSYKILETLIDNPPLFPAQESPRPYSPFDISLAHGE